MIIKRNLLTPIVIAVVVLVVILFFLGEDRDALFLSVVIVVNTLIAVIQEIRAKYALNKLELMSAPYAHRVSDSGEVQDILFSEIIVGDVLQLQVGDEVPADGKIISSTGLEVDESILTGESVAVEKDKGATVLAACSVVAGSATMKVSSVGADTKAGQMTVTLKRYKPRLTPLQRSISTAITFLTYGALVLSIIILVIYTLYGESPVRIFKTITVAAATVVPEGLLLASSLLLAFGAIKLAQARVLPQKLSAIEAMALLDVLCVDKTGTLTSDEIKFEKLEVFDKKYKYDKLAALLGIIARETSGGSSTGLAIVQAVNIPDKYDVKEILPFSSARKLSGVRLDYEGQDYSLILGAPEYIAKYAVVSPECKKRAELMASEGKRVLLFAFINKTSVSLKKMTKDAGKVVGLVVLSNELRVGVEKSVQYLQQNGVSIRVISGDNPNTVRYVASQVGIMNHQKVLTGDDLSKIPDSEWDDTVSQTAIFARVLPEQKERLIKTFVKLGNYTGMVGDGINDALAIKRSNLGIAMYSGAVATRRVADIILLDNSFNSLPLGMRLGNKIIQTIEMIATLFFHKIIFGVVLLFSTIFVGELYPFEPRHITFMNIFLVTTPTLIWTLVPPIPKTRISPRYFWRDTLVAIAPIAVLTGLCIAASYITLRNLHPGDINGVNTSTVIITTMFGIYMVLLVPYMFDVKNNRLARLARLLYILVAIFVTIPSFGLRFMREFFDFATPAWRNAFPMLLIVVLTVILQFILASMNRKRVKNREYKTLFKPHNSQSAK